MDFWEGILVMSDNNLRVASLWVKGIAAFGLVGAIVWGLDKMTLRGRQCGRLEKFYDQSPDIASIPENSELACMSLRDFYVKSSYNSCSIGDFKNDYVDLCALATAIRQGYRLLDFAVYAVDNKAVVAVSNVSDFRVKGSYNYVNFEDAMELVGQKAFDPVLQLLFRPIVRES